MSKRTCTVEDCARPHDAKGYCKVHYMRVKSTGSTDLIRREPLTCATADCDRPVQGRGLCTKHYAEFFKNSNRCTVTECDGKYYSGGYCRKHHNRMARHNTLDRVRPERHPICTIDGCSSQHFGRGYCYLHYSRWWRSSGRTTDFVGKQRLPNPAYSTVHKRLNKDRGRAAERCCIDCGERAEDWSYDNTGVDERISPEGMRYSTDVHQYSPRCKLCHKHFDNEERCSRAA